LAHQKTSAAEAKGRKKSRLRCRATRQAEFRRVWLNKIDSEKENRIGNWTRSKAGRENQIKNQNGKEKKTKMKNRRKTKREMKTKLDKIEREGNGKYNRISFGQNRAKTKMQVKKRKIKKN
jgi:hypothetical protein